MKRIALLTLLVFAATHLANADDKKNEKKQARQNAAAAKMATRNQNQVARHLNAKQSQASAAVRAQQAQNFNAAAVNRARTVNPTITPVLTPQVQQPTLEARNYRGSNRTWTGNNNNGNGNWQNNNNGSSGNWQNNNGGNGNWQGNNNGNRKWENNNDGNGNWNNNNNWNGKWKNRNANWHRRHGHWNGHHHDRSWWRSNFTRFALFGGGYYYWNSGYWYPAYGYDPYFNSYAYDAPIYAYNNQNPGQVIANVQIELQRRGYNPGGVDGSYGPMTRGALLRYQSDNGLPVTGEIDEETLDALGLR